MVKRIIAVLSDEDFAEIEDIKKLSEAKSWEDFVMKSARQYRTMIEGVS